MRQNAFANGAPPHPLAGFGGWQGVDLGLAADAARDMASDRDVWRAQRPVAGQAIQDKRGERGWKRLGRKGNGRGKKRREGKREGMGRGNGIQSVLRPLL